MRVDDEEALEEITSSYLIDVHLMIAKLNVKLPSQRLIPGGNWRKLAEIVDVEISGMLPIKFQ